MILLYAATIVTLIFVAREVIKENALNKKRRQESLVEIDEFLSLIDQLKEKYFEEADKDKILTDYKKAYKWANSFPAKIRKKEEKIIEFKKTYGNLDSLVREWNMVYGERQRIKNMGLLKKKT